jgi:hypothetical protein
LRPRRLPATPLPSRQGTSSPTSTNHGGFAPHLLLQCPSLGHRGGLCPLVVVNQRKWIRIQGPPTSTTGAAHGHGVVGASGDSGGQLRAANLDAQPSSLRPAISLASRGCTSPCPPAQRPCLLERAGTVTNTPWPLVMLLSQSSFVAFIKM